MPCPCGAKIERRPGPGRPAKFCSEACRKVGRKARPPRSYVWANVPREPCSSCGGATGWKRGEAKAPVCLTCRRASPARPTPPRVETWDCAGCGVACSRPATKGQRPKWCDECRLLSRDWVPVRVRREVYVRDEWTCWLCEEPVDRTLIGTHSEWRPSLDHVVPRSKGGTDDPTNLRLAHLWCNVVRNDERAYSPEDFRVSA